MGKLHGLSPLDLAGYLSVGLLSTDQWSCSGTSAYDAVIVIIYILSRGVSGLSGFIKHYNKSIDEWSTYNRYLGRLFLQHLTL